MSRRKPNSQHPPFNGNRGRSGSSGSWRVFAPLRRSQLPATGKDGSAEIALLPLYSLQPPLLPLKCVYREIRRCSDLMASAVAPVYAAALHGVGQRAAETISVESECDQPGLF